EVLDFLSAHHASSMFLLSNFESEAHGSFIHTTALAREASGGSLLGAAGLFNHNVLILQCEADPVGIAKFACSVDGVGPRAFDIILGPFEQVHRLCTHLDPTPKSLRQEHLYHLPLHQLRPPPLLNRSVRRARTADLDQLESWRAAYELETHGAVRDHKKMRARLRGDVAAGNIWLLEADATPLAMCAINARTKTSIQIGGVFTPKQYRGRGCARAAVAGQLEMLREEGMELAILFTALDNIPAQRAYEAIGFEQLPEDFGIAMYDECVTA
ncbi:unnamed protein product, partial [Laminaria digitata]